MYRFPFFLRSNIKRLIFSLRLRIARYSFDSGRVDRRLAQYGERNYGETYRQAAKLTGLVKKTGDRGAILDAAVHHGEQDLYVLDFVRGYR